MQKIGCRLLCFIANTDSRLCNLEHGKGLFDFFQNHVNHWWLLYVANICTRWLWLNSQNEHQLSVRYFLAFGTRWSFCSYLFLCVLLEQYAALLAPPLWQTVHRVSPAGKDLVFPNHSSLTPHPFLFPSSTAFEKEAQPFTGGFMVDPWENRCHL